MEYAILSVLNQTYQDWELLLINDGSTDKSLEICRRYESKDKRIRVLTDGVNKGLVARLNESVEASKGSYYARMDADDIMAVDRIEKQVKYLSTHPEVDVIGSSAILIDSKNIIRGSQNMSSIRDWFIHPSVMGKKEWFEVNRYAKWAVRIEDRELWTRTSGFSSFYNIPEPLLFYRAFGTQFSNQHISSDKRLRTIYRRYKEYGKPWSWYFKNIIFTYIKDIIFFICSLFRLNMIFIKIRKRKPIDNRLMLDESDLMKCIKFR